MLKTGIAASIAAITWSLLAAFVSLLPQWQALLSTSNGLLSPKSEWLTSTAASIGLSVDDTAVFVCLSGVFLCVYSLVVPWTYWKGAPILASALLYGQVMQGGATFMSFQWDILLVEAAVAASLACFSPDVGAVIVRFALAKLMLQSGAVKLQAGCPTWYELSATKVHFASQCIPTPLAWTLHNVPTTFNKLAVALTMWIEGPAVLLLLIPLPVAAAVGGWLQVGLQLLIILSGNYNFFNILTAALALSTLPSPSNAPFSPMLLPAKLWVGMQWALVLLGSYASWTWMIVTSWHFGDVRAGRLPWWHAVDVHLSDSLKSADGLATALCYALPIMVGLASLQLAYHALAWVVDAWMPSHPYVNNETTKAPNRCWNAFRTFWWAITLPACLLWRIAIIVAACILFAASSVNLLALEQRTLRPDAPIPLPTQVSDAFIQAYYAVQPWRFTSSYGLFRRMTGVGSTHVDSWGRRVVDTSRPELVIEGTWDEESGDGEEGEEHWKELELPYKPGHTGRTPPWLAPHQPRLDWQMWFAALGNSVHDSPWLSSLVRGLLEGEPSAYALMDAHAWPELANAQVNISGSVQTARFLRVPAAIRITRWEYDFSSPTARVPWIARTFIIRDSGKGERSRSPGPVPPQSYHPFVESAVLLLPPAMQERVEWHRAAAARAASQAGQASAWWVRRPAEQHVYLPRAEKRDKLLAGIAEQVGLPRSVPVTTVPVSGGLLGRDKRRVRVYEAGGVEQALLRIDTESQVKLQQSLNEPPASLERCNALVAKAQRVMPRKLYFLAHTLTGASNSISAAVQKHGRSNPSKAALVVQDKLSSVGSMAAHAAQPVLSVLACVTVTHARRLKLVPGPTYGIVLDVKDHSSSHAHTERLVYMTSSAHATPLWLLVAITALPLLWQVLRVLLVSCRFVTKCVSYSPAKATDRPQRTETRAGRHKVKEA